jgi:transposase-like protein
MNDSVLNSWKDIATHLHTSVRTAQRWEMRFHLPIHRPSGSQKGPVLAFEKELDEWIQNGGARLALLAGNGEIPRSTERRAKIRPQLASTHARAERMIGLAAEIRQRTEALQKQVERVMRMRAKINAIASSTRVSAAAN